MTESFQDHFSSLAARYADFRPHYPAELFDYLARVVARRGLVWDCACGSGQASVDLAERFERVIATDASAQQIKAAAPHPKIEYRVAPGEASGLANGTVDLVTVAQALHWFDVDRFYAEARRALRREGLIAVWTYAAGHVEGETADNLLQNYHYNILGPYWPAERRFVEEKYASLLFPFKRLETPEFVMRTTWTLDQLIGYLSSWSGTKRYVEANKENPLEKLRSDLRAVWPNSEEGREVKWPLSLFLGEL